MYQEMTFILKSFKVSVYRALSFNILFLQFHLAGPDISDLRWPSQANLNSVVGDSRWQCGIETSLQLWVV